MNEARSLSQQSTWDAVANGYSAVVSPQFLPFAEESLRLAGDRGLVLDRADVLDVGCGPGTLTTLLARRAKRVAAVDFSVGMIEALRSIAERDRLKNVEAEVMNATRLTFHDGSFDAVFSQFAIVFADDLGRAMREVRRVLRPAGVAVITTWSSVRPMRKAGEALAAVFDEAPRPEPRPMQEEDECRATMMDAGFAHVEVVSLSRSFPFSSVADFWTWMEYGTPGFTAVRARVGEDRWNALREDAMAHLRRELGDGPIELPAEARLSIARR